MKNYAFTIRSPFRQKNLRRIPILTRCVSWILILTQATFSLLPQASIAALLTAAKPQRIVFNTRPASPPPAPQVVVNRTLPDVQSPSPDINFSTNPSDAEISRTHIFAERLVPTGPTTAQENAELSRALTAFLQRTTNDDFSAITQFLSDHPQSAWRASLLLDVGLAYLHAGAYSRVLPYLDESWALTKDAADPSIKAIADRAVAELLETNVHLGRYDRLAALFDEIKGRTFISAVSEQIEGAREGYWYMQNRPEAAFRCGPLALNRIRIFENAGPDTNNLIRNSRSTVKGMSLSSICDLANKLGMNFQMAKRQPGSDVILPSVVHLKVGHYAALLKADGGKYFIEDPAFGNEHWISQSVLDDEASGYFVIPAGSLQSGWSPVGTDEGDNVWGKGPVQQSDPDDTKPTDAQNPQCGGGDDSPMAQYDFFAMLVSLSVWDTPVGYTPPRGPDMHFRVTYNQREANQPSVFSYSNFGPKWTFDWLSYISDTPGEPQDGVQYYVQGGGTEVYPGSSYNSSTKTFAADPDTFATLQMTSLTNYTRFLPDGSKQIFGLPNAPTNAASRQVFLTQIIDPSSNTLTFTYDSYFRMVAARDAIGQVTTISYASTNTTSPLFYEIAQVTDPFGRYASFTYNTNNELASITDILGIQSKFLYGMSDDGTMDFITNLTTPYGTTVFAETSYNDPVKGSVRWLKATDPLGQEQIQEFDEENTNIASSDPTNLVPGSNFVNNYLQYRNSFFWDKEAMQLYPSNYSKAQIQHWLHTDDYTTCTGVAESTKNALEDRVWNTYPGEPSTIQLGTNDSPSSVARVLDDGSIQTYLYQYNILGKLTKKIDPIGRAMAFVYAANNIDLQATYQLTGPTSSNLLSSYTYNSLHLPLTSVNAAGQTTHFGYNTNGQIVAETNAIGEISHYNYTTNGYLTNVVTGNGTLFATNSFTYDGYGRIRTATDPLGYTVTTSYDAADRPTNITYMDGTYEETVYQNLDPMLKRDRNGHWTAMLYDPLRRLTDTYDNAGRHTHNTWCGCGSLESTTDSVGNTTTWFRDLQGRVTTKTFPDGTGITYNYETNTSRLKFFTDANGQSTVYTYFADNNLAQVVYSNAVVFTPPVSYTYDTNYNRILTLTDGIGLTTYRYYSVASGQLGSGMLLSVSNSFIGPSSVISYSYDALNRLTNRAINSVSQKFAFDALHRITIMTNVLGSFTNTYVSDSQLLATNFAPFGKKTVYSYLSITNDERLAGIWNQNVNGSTLSQFNYGYDPVGNITNWTEQVSNSTPTVAQLQYDADNQLLNSTTLSNTVAGMVLKQYAYRYDLVGNRTSEQVGTTAGAPVAVSESDYNSENQVTNRVSNTGPVMFAGIISRQGNVLVAGSSATMYQASNFVGYASLTTGTNVVPVSATDYGGHSGTNTYQVVITNNGVAESIMYDANGNTTNIVTATSTNSYQWDAANRLIAITQLTPTNLEVSLFTYDGLGRRVEDIEETNRVAYVTNKFIWDGQALLEQRGNAGTNAVRRFFSQGEQISGTNYYFTSDHLGSIREVVNSSGVVESRYDYDPFGRQTLITGTAMGDLGFTGMYYHAISSLSLTFYRAYSADLGRWLSRDPSAEEGGLNLYGYVANNPINAFDILGLCSQSIWHLFGNGLNNTVSAIGQSMGLGLYDLATDNWSQDQGQWDQIYNEMYSMDTPENPAATPYIEATFAATAAAESVLAGGAAAFSAAGTSIFYSGAGAQGVATEMAAAGEGSTIFNTIGGSMLRSLGVENRAVWQTASWFYANTTGSQAIVVVGENGGVAGTVLGDVEFPVLAARGVNLIFQGVRNTSGL